MQIIESSIIGVRSAVRQFISSDGKLTVTIYPVLHIGEQQFYDQVYSEALSHDIVLAEGIKSPIVQRITRSYRWLPLKRLNLVL